VQPHSLTAKGDQDMSTTMLFIIALLVTFTSGYVAGVINERYFRREVQS